MGEGHSSTGDVLAYPPKTKSAIKYSTDQMPEVDMVENMTCSLTPVGSP